MLDASAYFAAAGFAAGAAAAAISQFPSVPAGKP